jgi:mRNA interferase RelE/StbE
MVRTSDDPPKRDKAWAVEFDDRARRELRKLDEKIQLAILRYLRSRIAVAEDPRRFGKPLRRSLAGLWRYRVEDYRLICRIEDERIVVLVLQVGHRRDVYED